MVHVPLKPELLPPNQSAPVPRLVKPRVPLSGALIVAALLPTESNGQQVIAGVEPVFKVMVLAPLTVQLLPSWVEEFPNTKLPSVWLASNVTFLLAEIARSKVALFPAPLARTPLAQLATLLQLPSASTVHELSAACANGVKAASNGVSSIIDKRRNRMH